MKHSVLLTLFVFWFASDPYGIAKELRAQASAKGFAVVSAVSELPQADLIKTCVMNGSWARNLGGGEISMRVVDAPSGALVAEVATAAANWWSIKRTVRGAVAKIYSQLGPRISTAPGIRWNPDLIARPAQPIRRNARSRLRPARKYFNVGTVRSRIFIGRSISS
jgi:hypothetical protein